MNEFPDMDALLDKLEETSFKDTQHLKGVSITKVVESLNTETTNQNIINSKLKNNKLIKPLENTLDLSKIEFSNNKEEFNQNTLKNVCLFCYLCLRL